MARLGRAQPNPARIVLPIPPGSDLAVADTPLGGVRTGTSPATATIDVLVTDIPQGGVRAGSSPASAISDLLVADVPVPGMVAGTSPAVAAFDLLAADAPVLGMIAGTSPAAVVFDLVAADAPQGGVRAGTSPAVVVADQLVADGAPNGLIAGTSPGTAVNATVVADQGPLGGVRTGTSPATVQADQLIADGVQPGVRAGTSPATGASATVAADPGPFGGSRAGTSPAIIVVDVLSGDTPLGALAGTSPATVSIGGGGGGTDVLVADTSPSGVLAGRSGRAVVHDPVVMPLVLNALDCLVIELAKTASPPKYARVSTGLAFVAALDGFGLDECCEGSVWVRVVNFYYTADFPAQVNTASACLPPDVAVVLEMGVTRCGPILRAGSSTDAPVLAPTAAQHQATLQDVMDDAAAMRRALCCLADPQDVVPGQWQPIESGADCVGGQMEFTLRADACDCVVP